MITVRLSTPLQMGAHHLVDRGQKKSRLGAALCSWRRHPEAAAAAWFAAMMRRNVETFLAVRAQHGARQPVLMQFPQDEFSKRPPRIFMFSGRVAANSTSTVIEERADATRSNAPCFMPVAVLFRISSAGSELVQPQEPVDLSDRRRLDRASGSPAPLDEAAGARLARETCRFQ